MLINKQRVIIYPMQANPFLVKAHQNNSQVIQCSLGDHLAFFAPVSVLFFYHEAIAKECMIEALKTVLHDFPLFAGRLVRSIEGLFIHCENQGVQMHVVYLNERLDVSLISLEELNTQQFIDPIYPWKALKKQLPLLTIKLTYFEKGMVIGYTWHHSLGDMATFMLFLKALSACAQGKAYPLPHIAIDRALYFKHYLAEAKITSTKNEKALSLKPLNFIDLVQLMKQACVKKECIYLYFPENEIRKLQEKLGQGIPLSRNSALCAHLLALTSRYRKHKGLYTSLAVNMRPRLQLPSDLLGNFSDLISVLIDKPHDAAYAAKQIHEAVQNYQSEYFEHPTELEKWGKKMRALRKWRPLIPKTLLPKQNQLVITNWTHFDVYTIDFGVTAPYLFLPVGRTPLPWVACIVEGFDNQDLLVTLVAPSTKKGSKPF